MTKPSPLVAVEVVAVPPAPVAGDFIGFFMETQKEKKSLFLSKTRKFLTFS
jgi:hypothetical protein